MNTIQFWQFGESYKKGVYFYTTEKQGFELSLNSDVNNLTLAISGHKTTPKHTIDGHTPHIDLTGNKGTAFVKLNSDNIKLLHFPSSKKIDSIYVDKCPYLEELIIERCYTSIFGLDKITKLIVLKCAGNGRVYELNLSKQLNLRELDFSHTAVMEIDLSKNTNLQRLICSINMLNHLDISKNVNLTELNCSVNSYLNELDVSKNTKLQRLSCSNCVFTVLDLSKNVNLTFLDCSNSRLTHLDISKNPLLQYVSCRGSSKLNTIYVSNAQMQLINQGQLRFNKDARSQYVIKDN